MTERILNEYDFLNPAMQLRVESLGLAGVAHIKKIGREALKWQITIFAENGQPICDFDGPEVYGEGDIIPSVADIEAAQHEINAAIEQFIWDPMSRA